MFYGVTDLGTFVLGTIFIVLVPGPNSLYVMTIASRYGIAAGYRGAAGIFVGDLILMTLAATGVASVFQANPALFLALKYAGAAYLVFLGLSLLRSAFARRPSTEAAPELPESGTVKPFRVALLISLMNPKAILFYVSFFVQFIDFSYAHTWISYLVLAGMLEAMSFVYLTLLIFGGTLMARFFRQRQTAARLGNGLIGLFFMGFAARLATLSS